MDRRAFIKRAGAVAGGAVLAAPAIAQTHPEITWRCQSSYGLALDTLYGAAARLAERVRTATDGRFRLEMVPAGENQIVAPLEVLDAVSADEITMCQTASYYFYAKDPTFALGTSIPFGLNARHFNAWMYHGGGDALMNAFYAKFGLYGLVGGNTGAQMGGWYRREIFSVDDLRGLKMRIGGLSGIVMAKLGIETRQLSGADTYAQLESGEIDAAEWAGPHDDEKLGLNRVAAYYYYPGFWEGSGCVHYFVNAQRWADLPLNYQSALQAAAAESNVWMLAKYDAANAAALRRLADSGVNVKPFTRDILDAAYRAALDVYAETSAGNPAFKRAYEQMMEFRRQIFRWFEICEYPFDSYVYAMASRGL